MSSSTYPENPFCHITVNEQSLFDCLSEFVQCNGNVLTAVAENTKTAVDILPFQPPLAEFRGQVGARVGTEVYIRSVFYLVDAQRGLPWVYLESGTVLNLSSNRVCKWKDKDSKGADGDINPSVPVYLKNKSFCYPLVSKKISTSRTFCIVMEGEIRLPSGPCLLPVPCPQVYPKAECYGRSTVVVGGKKPLMSSGVRIVPFSLASSVDVPIRLGFCVDLTLDTGLIEKCLTAPSTSSKYGRFGVRLSIAIGSHLVVDQKGKKDDKSQAIPAIVIRRGIQHVKAVKDIRVMPSSWHTILYGEMMTYTPNGPVLVRAGETFSFFPAEETDPCAIYVWDNSVFRSVRENFIAELPEGGRTEYALEPTLGHGYSCSVQIWSDPEPLAPYSGPVCTEIKITGQTYSRLSKPISERFVLTGDKCSCAGTCPGHSIGGVSHKSVYGGVVYTIIKNFNHKVRLRPEGVGHYETLCLSRRTLSSWFHEADSDGATPLKGIPEQFGSLSWDSLHTTTRFKVPEDMNVVRVIEPLISEHDGIVLTHGQLFKRLDSQYAITLECLNGGPSVDISFESGRKHLESVRIANVNKQEFESTFWVSHPDKVEVCGGFLRINNSDHQHSVTRQEDGSYISNSCPLGTHFRIMNSELRFLDGSGRIFQCSHETRMIAGRAEVVELGPQGTGSFSLGVRPRIKQVPAYLRHITDAFPGFNRWEIYRGNGTNLGIHKEIIPSMRSSCGRIIIPFFHEDEHGTVLVSKSTNPTPSSKPKSGGPSADLDYYSVPSGSIIRTKVQHSYGFIGKNISEWVLLVGYSVSIPSHPFVDWECANQSSESSGEEVNDEDLLINSIVGCVTYYDSPKWWIRDLLGPCRETTIRDGKPKLTMADSIAWHDIYIGLTDQERSLIMLVGVFLANKNRQTIATATSPMAPGISRPKEIRDNRSSWDIIAWLGERTDAKEEWGWLVTLWDIFTQNPTACYVRPQEFAYSKSANMSSFCRGQSSRVERNPKMVTQGVICLAAKRREFLRVRNLWKFDPTAMLQCIRNPASPVPKRSDEKDGADQLAISFVESHLGHPWWDGFLSPLPPDVVTCAKRLMSFLLKKSDRITVTVTLYSYSDVLQDSFMCHLRRGAIMSDVILDLISRNVIIGSEQDPEFSLSEGLDDGQVCELYGASCLDKLGYKYSSSGGWSLVEKKNIGKGSREGVFSGKQVSACVQSSDSNDRLVEDRYKEFILSQIEDKRSYLCKCPYDTPVPGPVLEATSVSKVVGWGDASILIPSGKSFSIDGVDISNDGDWPELEGCINSPGPKLLSMGRFNKGSATVVSHHGSIAVRSSPSVRPVIVPEGSVVKTGPDSEVLCLDSTSVTIRGVTTLPVVDSLRIRITRSVTEADIVFGAGSLDGKSVIRCGRGNSSSWLKEASLLEGSISSLLSQGKSDIMIGIIDTRRFPRHGELGSWVESVCKTQGYPVQKDDRPSPNGLGDDKGQAYRGPIDDMIRFHLQGTPLSERYPVFSGTVKILRDILSSGEISKNRLSRLAVKNSDASNITYESSWSDILMQAVLCKRTSSSDKVPLSPVTKALIELFLKCIDSDDLGSIQQGIRTSLISNVEHEIKMPEVEILDLVSDDQFKGYVSVREGERTGLLEAGRTYTRINKTSDQIDISLFGLRATGVMEGSGLLVSQGNVDKSDSRSLRKTGFQEFQIPISTHIRKNRVFVKIMPGGWLTVRCNVEVNRDGTEKNNKQLRASMKRREELITASQKLVEIEKQTEQKRKLALLRKDLFGRIEARAAELGSLVVDRYEKAIPNHVFGSGDLLSVEDFTVTGVMNRPTITYDGPDLVHSWCDRITGGFPTYSLTRTVKALFTFTPSAVSGQSCVDTLLGFHQMLMTGVTKIPTLAKLRTTSVRPPRPVGIMSDNLTSDHINPTVLSKRILAGEVVSESTTLVPKTDNYDSDDCSTNGDGDSSDFMQEVESDGDLSMTVDSFGNSLWEPLSQEAVVEKIHRIPGIKDFLSVVPDFGSSISSSTSSDAHWWVSGPRHDIQYVWGGPLELQIGPVVVPPSNLSSLVETVRDLLDEKFFPPGSLHSLILSFKKGARTLLFRGDGSIFKKESPITGVVLQGEGIVSIKSRSQCEERKYELGAGSCFSIKAGSHPFWCQDIKRSKKRLIVVIFGHEHVS
jgi:hypothetical protein